MVFGLSKHLKSTPSAVAETLTIGVKKVGIVEIILMAFGNS